MQDVAVAYDTDSDQKISLKLIFSWITVLLGATFYFYEYFLRIVPEVMTSDLRLAFHINVAAMGSLISVYYWIYVPMQLVVGVLMDRYGPRWLLTIACITCSIGNYLFANNDWLAVAGFGRFLVGFGSAFAFVGVLKLAALWLPQRQFALASGFTLMFGMIGAYFGVEVLSYVVEAVGWRLSIYYGSCFGFVLALLLFLVIPDHEQHQSSQMDLFAKNGLKTNLRSMYHDVRHLLMKPQIWLNGAIGCLLFLPTTGFAELWGFQYLQDVYHFTRTQAAEVTGFIFIGWAIGGPLAGWASSRIRQRRLPMTIGAAVASVLIAIVLYMPHLSKGMLDLIFLTFGMFSATQILVFPIARELSPDHLAGTAVSVTNMLCMLGGMIIQPLVGVLLELTWSGQTVHGLEYFSASNYQMVLSVFPIATMLTVFLTFFLKETACKQTVAD